jgi:hypothetical protein
MRALTVLGIGRRGRLRQAYRHDAGWHVCVYGGAGRVSSLVRIIMERGVLCLINSVLVVPYPHDALTTAAAVRRADYN